MDAAIIKELLTTDMRPSVITHEEDNRVVRESFIIQPFEDLSDLLI